MNGLAQLMAATSKASREGSSHFRADCFVLYQAWKQPGAPSRLAHPAGGVAGSG